MKALAPTLQLHTSPLPGGPGAWVICCFFKLAPHPWTVCQEGPLFMRIPRWLQLTLRCTILGLCPELFLFFFEPHAPLPPPDFPLPPLNQTISPSLVYLSKALRGGGSSGGGCMEAKPFEELSGGRLTWVSRAALHPSLGEEAGRPPSSRPQRRMSGHLGWFGVGVGGAERWGSEWRWGWGGNKREAGDGNQYLSLPPPPN